MLHDAITDLSPRAIDLLKLVDVVLVSTQCLVVDILDAALRTECIFGVRELGLVEAKELVPVSDRFAVSNNQVAAVQICRALLLWLLYLSHLIFATSAHKLDSLQGVVLKLACGIGHGHCLKLLQLVNMVNHTFTGCLS